MWEHQRRWWNLPNFIRGLVTGYGGGKTIQVGKRMIWLSLVNAPHVCFTVSPSYPMARTTMVATLDELLEGKCRHESEKRGVSMSYKFLKSTPYTFEIRHDSPTGTREGSLLCMSGDKPDAIRGLNGAAAGVDEPFLMGNDVFKQVIARTRHPLARRREINIGGTPEGVLNWGYELFEGELREALDVGLVQAPSAANKALPADYVPNLLSAYDDNAAAAYVEGKFVNLSAGRVYHAFDPTVHVVDEPMPDGAELGCGMDFNVDPMAFVVFWRKGDRVHFFAEYELANSDTDEAAAELKAKHPGLRLIYPDASGKSRSTSAPRGRSDHKALADAGFTLKARPANPLRRDRYNAVNGGFKNRRVTIATTCRKLRTYLMAFVHKEANTARHKAMGHLLDAAGYPVAYLMPIVSGAMKRVPFSGA